MKKFLCANLLIIFILTSVLGNISFAEDDSGRIDFFKVFSDTDVNINRIGNSIHNWSIYLPSDGVVNKNSKATSFFMTSSSYKANISVNVLKNIHNFSLEELYAKAASTGNNGYSPYDSSCICSSSIKKDKEKNNYISICSIIPISFMSTDSDISAEQGMYNEQRIYLGKSGKSEYIYDVNFSMDIQFYEQHPGLFLKLADSFKTNFDSTNPNIKDLSEQLNAYRMYESKLYGWKIELAPYWKLQSSEISTNQTFNPLYSDEEIGDKESSTDSSSSQLNKINDFLNITLLSSIPEKQNFDQWTDGEIKNILTGYNKSLFKQINQTQTIKVENTKKRQLIYELNNTSTNSTINAITYVEGNGYRYKMELSMKKLKYNEKSGKASFDRMLNSFALTNTKSNYIKDLLPVDSVFNLNAARTIAMKKFSLKILADNNWLENFSIYDGQLDEDYQYYDDSSFAYDYDNSSTRETITVNHSISGATLTLTGESSTETVDKKLKTLISDEFSKQDTSSGILILKMSKAKAGNNTVYRISENYSLRKMKKLSAQNNKKSFNYNALYDTYIYIFKQDDDLFTISFSIPFINSSEENLKILESIWHKTVANNIDIGAKALNWHSVSLDKYKK